MTHPPRSTLLQHFARDVTGNALAIMAAAILPMVAAVGGAIDISRNYMAQSRLQQACDAGVLAGRKKQGGTTFGTAAQTEAQEFFKINYPDGTYGATNVQFTPTSTATNEVNGVARVFIPATVARVIGYQGQQLEVNCTAKLDLTNTDVMFVLDSSGSMASGSGTPGVNRIEALKQAVRDFHSVLESAKRQDTQVRYGFVAYSSTVNVGALLMSKDPLLVDTRHNYQTRQWIRIPDQAECQRKGGIWFAWTGQCSVPGYYKHFERSLDLGPYVRGNTIQNPANRYGGDLTWTGCIEERATVATNDFSVIPAGAWDLNIDADSAGGDDDRQWRAVLDGAYARNNRANAIEEWSESNSAGGGRWRALTCPRAKGQLVQTMSAGEIDSYVNTLSADGSTYHDLGIVWGLRLISPTGLWATRNTSSPNRLPITRHIIFMTDGQMSTPDATYSGYGLERHDERVGGGDHSDTGLSDRHNARFLAVCDLAKKQYNVRIWTIAFGEPLSNTKLAQCADAGRAFEANNATELNDTFRRIATRIADLRLEQ